MRSRRGRPATRNQLRFADSERLCSSMRRCSAMIVSSTRVPSLKVRKFVLPCTTGPLDAWYLGRRHTGGCEAAADERLDLEAITPQQTVRRLGIWTLGRSARERGRARRRCHRNTGP